MSRKITKEELLKRFDNLFKDKYNFNYEIGDVKGVHDKIKLICDKHGDSYVRIWDHLNGTICKECSNENRRRLQSKGTDNFIKISKSKFGNKFDYSKVNYVNNRTKIDLICKEHNLEFYQTPSQHLNGNISCPKCKPINSLGENFIRNFLKQNSINFIEQHSIKGCRSKKILKFDFYLKDYSLIIEYDGKQHFIKGWNSDEEFERLKTNDAIKNKYCIDNNIDLLRIGYKDYKNISLILKNKLGL